MLSFFTGTFSQFLQNFWQNFPRAIENAAAGHKWPAGPGLDHPELNHPSLKSLFARMAKVLPSETAARACVAKLASQKEEQIQELLRDKKKFF